LCIIVAALRKNYQQILLLFYKLDHPAQIANHRTQARRLDRRYSSLEIANKDDSQDSKRNEYDNDLTYSLEDSSLPTFEFCEPIGLISLCGEVFD